MTAVRLVVVGDALLDRDVEGRVERLCPEAPVPVVDALAERSRPGGAALAAALAAADGQDVVLITALAADEPGHELRGLIEQAGVELVDLGLAGPTPEKVRVRSDGRLLIRLDHGGRPAPTVGAATPAAAAALRSADGVLVEDYGRGVAREPSLRSQLQQVVHERPLVWDPHPRGPQPVVGATLVTPNAGEAATLVGEPTGGLAVVERQARALQSCWRAEAVAVTMGANGALLVGGGGGPCVVMPAPPVVGGDPCGAGDRFASTAAARLAAGEAAERAVAAAVETAAAFVARGGAGGFTLDPQPQRDDDDAARLAERVRRRGGRVVATGGCFDLLHAGHVSLLEAARALGDCLIVCLNSDESVRRLKGPDRPLVPQDERAALLRSLRFVDAVAIFDEDTPEQLLSELRPGVFAKGGDYSAEELPEARVLAGWGGETVILPYVDGRSTTRLLEEAAARAG